MKTVLRLSMACLLLLLQAEVDGRISAQPVVVEGIEGRLAPLTGEMRLSGANAADAEIIELTDAQTDGHGPGFRLITKKQPGFHYGIEARLPLTTGIRQGETFFASFWARTVEADRYETGEGFTLFRVQRVGPPFERGLYREWTLGPQWKKYYLADRFTKAVPAGQVAAVFSGGYPPQAIEIAGLEVVNFGRSVDPNDLPAISLAYTGSEPDAAWRTQALERIEKIRKAELSLAVVDADGRPLPGAEVEVELATHAFDFGVAISADWLAKNWDTPQADTYLGTLPKHFNSIAIENALKWSWWERDPDVALRTLRWIKQNTDLRVHGHVLVWPGLEKFRTEDAEELWAAAQDNPELLRTRVANHMESILTATAGMIDVWDVVNEAYNQNEFIHLLGDDIVVEWFQMARKHAPDATLIYNDFALLGQNGTNRVKHQFVYDLIKDARAKGAPIDALGFQAHLGGGYTPPTRVLEILDKFADLGIGLQITEYDLSTANHALAEKYTKDFLIAIFSHPSVTAFQGWNYWSATPTWMPEAAWFDADWELMPVGRAFHDLVHGEWKTRASVQTDSRGQAKVRGFLGAYRVTVTTPDGQSTHRVTLERNAEPVTITHK
ncbi:MAG: endo-1,4-beta-xylanase [Planctomycetota bacterium]